MQAHRAGGRRMASLAGGLVLVALAIVLGVVGAAVGFLAASLLSTSVPLLGAAGLVSSFGASAIPARPAARLLGVSRRRSLVLGVGFGTAALVALASALTLFRPLVPLSERQPPDPPPDTRFWDLPTGSRIAYRKLGADAATLNPPIVYLHGGPGAGVVTTPAVAKALSFLTELGYDVYLYDQVGGGRSGRLPNARQYTVERHVSDLDAIRRILGTEQMILIGESWGGVLASQYIAGHPQQVQRCVFISPGPLPGCDWGRTDPCDLKGHATPEKRAAFDRLVSRAAPRVLTAELLLELNPAAASAFLPDSEADAFARRLFSLLLEKMVCDPSALPGGADFDFGLWGNLKTDEDASRQRTRIDDRLRAFEAPVLILRGECDYCTPEVARQYEAVYPQPTLVSLREAGHLVWLDRPTAFAEAVRAFLTGQNRDPVGE